MKTLTQSGHPFITHPQRRFAPITVRFHRNAVRHGSEWVSGFIGIRRNNQAQIAQFEKNANAGCLEIHR